MILRLETQFAVDAPGAPSEADFRIWAETVLTGRRGQAELVIRIVDTAEMVVLNRRYRNKNGPTNVLSFPFQAPEPAVSDLLGDLVICAPSGPARFFPGQRLPGAPPGHGSPDPPAGR